jgi:hypothetical protein
VAKTNTDLIALYGWCPVCHSPRDRRMYQHIEPNGFTHYWTTIICLAEPVAHHGDLDMLTDWQRAAMSSDSDPGGKLIRAIR